MYFDAVLLLRAVARLGPYLSEYDYCGTNTGTHEDDVETVDRLTKVIDIARAVGRFDESVLFRGENANVLKQEFKEHFRNVTRIMDCVGCDKCRLWGKVQTTGIATALKVLFELDEKALEYVLAAFRQMHVKLTPFTSARSRTRICSSGLSSSHWSTRFTDSSSLCMLSKNSAGCGQRLALRRKDVSWKLRRPLQGRFPR